MPQIISTDSIISYFSMIFFITFYSCTSVEETNTTELNLFLDAMKVGETVRFDMSSQGCFHGDTYEMSVEKMTNDYEVIFNNKRTKLTSSQFELLRKFETELRGEHRKGCSTKNLYLITNTFTHTTYKKIDDGCQWNGFFNLIVALKLNGWEAFKS